MDQFDVTLRFEEGYTLAGVVEAPSADDAGTIFCDKMRQYFGIETLGYRDIHVRRLTIPFDLPRRPHPEGDPGDGAA